jgi:hypothetical protein
LSGCLRPLQPDPMEEDVLAFVPPTLLPSPKGSQPTEHPETDTKNTPEAACFDNLTFVKDISYPDGSEVRPSTKILKEWEVKNSGTCNWTKGYTIRLISGQALNASETIDLFPARSDTTLVIQMEFTTPDKPGEYHSAWQAYNPANIPFGDSFFLTIKVLEQ